MLLAIALQFTLRQSSRKENSKFLRKRSSWKVGCRYYKISKSYNFYVKTFPKAVFEKYLTIQKWNFNLLKIIKTHSMQRVSFYISWKYQKTTGFSDLFIEYRKSSVAWNGLKNPLKIIEV